MTQSPVKMLSVAAFAGLFIAVSTAPIAEAVEQSLQALKWLQKQGATQIIYKICSTFDSTKSGNIGPVLDALSEQMKTPVALVCPAFPENGRSVYQGHLFVGDRPLNESGMQNHPLTPMLDQLDHHHRPPPPASTWRTTRELLLLLG